MKLTANCWSRTKWKIQEPRAAENNDSSSKMVKTHSFSEPVRLRHFLRRVVCVTQCATLRHNLTSTTLLSVSDRGALNSPRLSGSGATIGERGGGGEGVKLLKRKPQQLSAWKVME